MATASDEITAPTREAVEGEEFRVKAGALLSPDEVRALSVLSPLRATRALLRTFALTGGAIAAAILFPHPAVIALAIVAIAGGQHGLAVLAHEAAHYRMYRTRWLNDLVGRISSTPLGISVIGYRLIHRIHHNHLYEPIDPDLALMAGYPRGKLYLAKKLAKDLLGLTTVKNYLYFFRSGAYGGSTEKDDTSASLRRAAKRDRAFVVATNLALPIAFFAAGHLGDYLLLWILPLLTVLQAILRLRAVLEHGAVTDTSTPLRAARTNLPSSAVAWFLFPHDVHYHIEHHLYPSVPHYHLAECHRRLKKNGALEGAEVSTLGPVFKRVFAEVTTSPTG